MSDAQARVSVVIPTVLRNSVVQAIASARSQTVPVDIICVVDAPQSADEHSPDLLGGADTVLYTGGGRGGAHARNLGTSAANSEYVAYLDDDDLWLPDKLRRQLAAADVIRDHGIAPIVSCQALQRFANKASLSQPVPRAVYEHPEPIGTYLFRRRSPSVTRASLFTSSLLVHAELAKRVPWRVGLSRHQDWDWLIELDSSPLTRLAQLPIPLCVVNVGSPGSISARADWASSLAWARERTPEMGTRTFVDFVAGQSLRYALQARSPRGVSAVFGVFARDGLPSWSALALGLTGIAPRSVTEAAMHGSARVASASRRLMGSLR